MRTIRHIVGGSLLGGLVATALGIAIAQVPSAGGAFLPLESYVIGSNATWTWLNSSPWVIEGSTVDNNETTITFTNPTGDRTVTIQDTTGTVVLAAGVTSGAVASGSLALDGSNPSSVSTGLSVLLGCAVTYQESTAPGDNVAMFSVQTTAGAGRLDVYAWEFISGTDPTLVASDWTGVVQWFCNGTR